MEVTETVQVEQVVETPVVNEVKPEVAIPEKKESLSSQFAALAKKEKRILSERQSLEAQNKELSEKLQKYEQFEAKKKNAKLNPLDFLSEAGLTYDELTQFMLNGGKAPQKDKATELEEKLNEFMSNAENEKKQREENEIKKLQEDEQKAIQQFKDSVKKQLGDKKDTYELINLYDAQDLVISTIEAHYEKTQQILDTDTAADLVEKHLEDEVKKLANARKFKDQFKLAEEKPKEGQAKDSVTLNSQMSASSVPSSLPAHTETDRIKRALAALG